MCYYFFDFYFDIDDELIHGYLAGLIWEHILPMDIFVIGQHVGRWIWRCFAWPKSTLWLSLFFKILMEDGVWPPERKKVSAKAICKVYLKPFRFMVLGTMVKNKHFFCFRSFGIKDGSKIWPMEEKWLTNPPQTNTLLCII
jgi:hypothetical protein